MNARISDPRRRRLTAFLLGATCATVGAGTAHATTPPPPPIGVVTSTTTTTSTTTSTTVVPAPPSPPTVPETGPSSSDAPPETPAPPTLPPSSAPPVTDPPPAVTALEVEATACEWNMEDDYFTGDVDQPIAISWIYLRMNDDLCEYDDLAFGDPLHGSYSSGVPAQYTPDPGYVGTDEFTFQLILEGGVVAESVVHVLVSDCAVTAQPDQAHETPMDTPYSDPAPGVLGNDILDCSPLTLSAGAPDHGTAVLQQDGSFEYQPDAGFAGHDYFTYELRDGSGTLLANSAVRILVIGPPCVAEDDVYTVTPDALLTVPAPGILNNDVLCPGYEELLVSDLPDDVVEHGTLTVDDHGGFQYLPDAGYVGPDEFVYRLRYENSSSEAVVTIEVKAPPCSNMVVDDVFEMLPDTSLHVAAPGAAANDTVCAGHQLVMGDPPTHGTATLGGDGAVGYTPDVGFVGSDSFTYTLGGGPAGFTAAGFRSPRAPTPRFATVTIIVTEAPQTTTTSTTAPGPTTTLSPAPTTGPSGQLPQTG